MLLEFKKMTEEELHRLTHDVYPEGCLINAKWRYPDKIDLSAAIEEEANYFAAFLREKFFAKENNTYYVLEVDGQWVSALRLTKLDDFYYLEALETPPLQRKKGYASRILNEVIDHLKQDGVVIIRDNVAKENEASLATHYKCGFRVELEEAVNFLSGKKNPNAYGLIYKGK